MDLPHTGAGQRNPEPGDGVWRRTAERRRVSEGRGPTPRGRGPERGSHCPLTWGMQDTEDTGIILKVLKNFGWGTFRINYLPLKMFTIYSESESQIILPIIIHLIN